MGLMTMDKSLIGAGLMMVVLNLAVIAPIATGDMMVTAVNDGMSDLYLEGMCADEDCNDLSDDWKSSICHSHRCKQKSIVHEFWIHLQR